MSAASELLKAEEVVMEYTHGPKAHQLDEGQRATLLRAHEAIAQVTAELLTQDDTADYDDEEDE